MMRSCIQGAAIGSLVPTVSNAVSYFVQNLLVSRMAAFEPAVHAFCMMADA